MEDLMHVLSNVGLTFLFGAIGIIILGVGYKVIDWIVPADFNKELENGNIAVAIVVAGFLVAIGIVVSTVVA